jgi:hypothetical protein
MSCVSFLKPGDLLRRNVGLEVRLTKASSQQLLDASRSVTQRVLHARTQAELLERTAASVLAGDVLRVDILAEPDLHLEAAQAVYQTSQVFSQTLPNALGVRSSRALAVHSPQR